MSRIPFMTSIRRTALATLPCALLACESPTDVDVPTTGTPPATVAFIEVQGVAGGITVGENVAMSAVVRAANGAALVRAVAWSTSDTLLAVISDAGVLTARAGGVVQVSAAADGQSSAVSVHIRNATPAAAQLSPASAISGEDGITLTITGTGFAQGATVLWNAQPRTTTVISATELRVEIPADDLRMAGVAGVLVVNPAPGTGLVSNLLTFAIEQPPVLWTTYRLEGVEAERMLPAEVGRGEWTDENGTRHDVIRRALSGTVRIRSQAGSSTQWEQVVTIATYLAASGAEAKREHFVWAGSLMYDMWDGSMVFQSHMAGMMEFRTRTVSEDEFVMYQVLDSRGREEDMKPWVYVKQ